jgi:signal peptidase I
VKLVKISLLFLIPVLLLGAVVAYATHSVPYRLYVIHTGSMSPTIPPESVAVVRVGEYHVGQVITFNTFNGVVTHRLVSVKDGMMTTKGDANATVDPWKLPTSNIIGQVVTAPKKLGYWMEYLKNPLGLASLLLAVVASWQIWSLANLDGRASTRRRSVGGRPAPRHRIRSAGGVPG